ncbi:protoporphyrinogen oxidase [Sporosarcina highlanderae]|uniref:Coproporphyrinogen III oxidase n=1 Tax=Sporosarcina highlanderae TaxID=3035916 RepID=A0ABT8JQS1_9BACL|nr:protoporphyrinogen oxidase [Sporosarcina highlanderae]MDN4606767.1 protoporphyrinogen oxidase [Sporosarcina highlanderae]
MIEQKKKVVVVGGGITGLAAAFYMQKAARERNLPIEVVLIEANNRLGGKIQTVRRDGFVVERGPDSFLIRKKSMEIFAEDLGIEGELVRNATGQAHILVNGQLQPIPPGSVMGIPTKMGPFLGSGLFSLSGKLRAAGDLFLPRSGIEGDQSLGHFFRRRFGREMVENLIEPLLSGVYAGDIDQMSLQSTYPQFYQVEKKHRSLILGMKKTTPKQVPQKDGHGASKQGAFHSFRNGLETIVEAAEQQLEPGTVKKGIRIESISKQGDQTLLELNNGETVLADAVIVTTGHMAASQLFASHGLLEGLKEIQTTSVATVALAFPADAVVQDKEGTGFLVSRNGNYSITACTWVHRKWPTTTPEGKILLRAFVGRIGEEAIVDLPDDEIERIVLEDLGKILTIKGKPDFSVITRFKEDRPQYRVGHRERVDAARAELQKEFPNVKLAGASYNGVGLPDCIDQGKAAVEEVLGELFTN